MKIYIAGEITGDDGYRAKFQEAAKNLEALGHVVLNPAILPTGLEERDYMRITLVMLEAADLAVFLPDYQERAGHTPDGPGRGGPAGENADRTFTFCMGQPSGGPAAILPAVFRLVQTKEPKQKRRVCSNQFQQHTGGGSGPRLCPAGPGVFALCHDLQQRPGTPGNQAPAKVVQ